MSYSVADLKNDITATLHGTTDNQIQNFNGAINRAARTLLLDIDPQETKRQVEFVNPIFNSVFDYPIAADVKGNKIIDIYPQVQRIPQDIWTQAYNQAFDVAKQNIFSMVNMFTINFNSSLKTIRVNAPFLNPPVIVNQIEAISTNGTWAVGGEATNLAVNNTNFAQGAGSLQFNAGFASSFGPNLVSNGSFTGSLAGWTVQNAGIPGWQYGTNNAQHVPQGSSQDYLYQSLNLTAGTYRVTATIGGTTGTVYAFVGTLTGGGGQVYNAGVGAVSFIINANDGDGIFFESNSTSTGFDGTIDDVTVEAVLAGVNYIENSTMEAVNLSEVEDQSYLFVWVYVPTGSNLTSVELRWGSSASNYWNSTVTQNQQATAFVNGWNLCQFIWSSAATFGTPDSSSITYARVTLNVTAAMTACLVNGLDSILGTILSYSYYSKYMFRNASTGTYQETVLDDSDLINLDTESFNLLTYQVLYLVTQQQQGLDATFYDGSFAKNAYDAGVIRYKSMYKSELQKPQSVYYQTPDTSYNRFLGRGWW